MNPGKWLDPEQHLLCLVVYAHTVKGRVYGARKAKNLEQEVLHEC